MKNKQWLKIISFNRYVEGLIRIEGLPKSTGTFTGDYELYRVTFPGMFKKWEGEYVARATRERLGIA